MIKNIKEKKNTQKAKFQVGMFHVVGSTGIVLVAMSIYLFTIGWEVPAWIVLLVGLFMTMGFIKK